jgi:hypothetical protein
MIGITAKVRLFFRNKGRKGTEMVGITEKWRLSIKIEKKGTVTGRN